jgi:hypothetical protein
MTRAVCGRWIANCEPRMQRESMAAAASNLLAQTGREGYGMEVAGGLHSSILCSFPDWHTRQIWNYIHRIFQHRILRRRSRLSEIALEEINPAELCNWKDN